MTSPHNVLNFPEKKRKAVYGDGVRQQRERQTPVASLMEALQTTHAGLAAGMDPIEIRVLEAKQCRGIINSEANRLSGYLNPPDTALFLRMLADRIEGKAPPDDPMEF